MNRDANGKLDSITAKGTWSVPAITAGLLAVIISYAGPLAIFFQAEHAAHVGNDMVASWVWSISMGAHHSLVHSGNGVACDALPWDACQ